MRMKTKMSTTIDECSLIITIQYLSLFSILANRLGRVWVLHDVHYISTLLHPLLKQFQIAPHERQIAMDLVKAEILRRQSSVTYVSVMDLSSAARLLVLRSKHHQKQQPRVPRCKSVMFSRNALMLLVIIRNLLLNQTKN